MWSDRQLDRNKRAGHFVPVGWGTTGEGDVESASVERECGSGEGVAGGGGAVDKDLEAAVEHAA